MTAAAIKGVFANYRPALSRNVVQAIIEFPAEQQQQMFDTLGYPVPGESIWVVVARLQNPEEASPREPPSARPSAASPADGPPPLPLAGATPKVKDLAKSELMRSLYRSLSPGDRAVADAVLLAKNEAFRSWITGGGACSEADAADFIRLKCGVHSRSELAANEGARARFDRLVGRYQLETGRIAEARG